MELINRGDYGRLLNVPFPVRVAVAGTGETTREALTSQLDIPCDKHRKLRYSQHKLALCYNQDIRFFLGGRSELWPVPASIATRRAARNAAPGSDCGRLYIPEAAYHHSSAANKERAMAMHRERQLVARHKPGFRG